jgi:ABC-type uncharacterized transport system permease subunit
VLGVIRTLWLAPALGPVVAVALELPLMLAASALVARRLLKHWPLRVFPALVAGVGALVLLLLAEAAVSLLAGRDLAAHLALYARPEAQLGLAGQGVFALIPALLVWRKRT